MIHTIRQVKLCTQISLLASYTKITQPQNLKDIKRKIILSTEEVVLNNRNLAPR